MDELARIRHEQARDIANKSRYVKQLYLAKKQFSWSYIRYRVMRPLLKVYKQWLIRPYGNEVPWLTPAAIEILNSLLTREMKGLEYGSGRSTLFFSTRSGELDSIEHHHEWFEKVKAQLHSLEVSNVQYHWIEGDKSESNTEIEARNNQPFDVNNPIYEKYIEHITQYPDASFDFILIDGRARTECSRLAIQKLKSGGIFILDNSERKRYEPVHHDLNSWPSVNTTSGLTNTTFWFKP